jgi:hypothetical protein
VIWELRIHAVERRSRSGAWFTTAKLTAEDLWSSPRADSLAKLLLEVRHVVEKVVLARRGARGWNESPSVPPSLDHVDFGLARLVPKRAGPGSFRLNGHSDWRVRHVA